MSAGERKESSAHSEPETVPTCLQDLPTDISESASLGSNRFGKDRSSSLYLLVLQQTSELLTVKTAYDDREATRVDREDVMYRSLVRMPTQRRRLLMADKLAE